jgi:hypothetical protein
MVQPSPFQRLLQEVSKTARSSPAEAFVQLDELYGKTTTDADVLHLGAFATNLGGAALGRWDETIVLVQRCLDHSAVAPDSAVARSLHRALAVLFTCSDRPADAAKEIRAGITTPSEECRFSGAAAQTLLARNRAQEALVHLAQAARLCRDLPPTDEVVATTAGIAANLLRVAEPQCLLAHELLLAATEASMASSGRSEDWKIRHKTMFHHGKAWLLAGNPMRALVLVQQMMETEETNDAGPVERFYSANLACRAQAMRGQFKVAAGALGACRDFTKEAEQLGEPLGPALEDLQKYVDGMKTA